MALPLIKAVGLVRKTIQAAACTDIACASCEMCSYHLGLESLDLLPPFKDIYICDCNRTYNWQCLLKTNCYNVNEQEAIDTHDTWACPAIVNLNENEKREWTFQSLKRELVKVSWNTIW